MPETTHRTIDGVEITPGLRVFSIDCEWGTVDPAQFTRGGSNDPGGQYFDGWFTVVYDAGRHALLNGERIATCDRITGSTDPRAVPAVVNGVKLTEASHALFIALAEDAGNWSSMVPTDGNVQITKEQRGNLTQLKRAGLLVTQRDDGETWVLFTAQGVEYAKAHGVEYIEALAS